MKKILNLIIHFWPIIILIISCFLFLLFFSKLGNSESFNVVLGISLGVLLGVLADMSKRTIDAFSEKKIFKKTALRLLEQDAKNIFRMFEMWKGIRETAGKPGSPPDIDKILPPELEMRYWNKFSLENDFLMLAADPGFEDIFNKFWDFEKIEKLIKNSKEEQDEGRRKQSYMFAMAISIQVITDGSHEDILKLFLEENELEEYKSNWRKEKPSKVQKDDSEEG